MEGEVFFTGDRHTYIHTHGHRDSMTESAKWADSVKRGGQKCPEQYRVIIFSLLALVMVLFVKVLSCDTLVKHFEI